MVGIKIRRIRMVFTKVFSPKNEKPLVKHMFVTALLVLSLNSFAKTKILVSYFEPFKGRSENHTKVVAEVLAKMQSLKDSQIEIVLCPLDGGQGLPVSFHSERPDLRDTGKKKAGLSGEANSFTQVKDCIDKNPDISSVYSLGEAPCKVTYENVAYNAMETGAASIKRDSNGNLIPDLQRIDAGSNASLQLDQEKNIQAFCLALLSNEKFKEISVAGKDPGTYVCNNLAYNVQKYIRDRNLKIGYEFVHIPVSFERSSDGFCGSVSFKKIPASEKSAVFTRMIAENISQFMVSKELLVQPTGGVLCNKELLPNLAKIGVQILLKSPEMMKCVQETSQIIAKERVKGELKRSHAK
jgi:pyrrolidone-carboxylate peptidase